MRYHRLAIVGTVLAALISGCGEEENKPVEAAKPTDNAHLDQMKNEMLKQMKIKTPARKAQ